MNNLERAINDNKNKDFESFLKDLYDFDASNPGNSRLWDIAKNGCDAGYEYITTYNDLVKIYDAFTSDIWEALSTLSEESGYTSVMLFLHHNGYKLHIHDHETMVCVMVWLVIDFIAYCLTTGQDWPL